ncbi:unnamed protein product [Choristocarpus tenellus]
MTELNMASSSMETGPSVPFLAWVERTVKERAEGDTFGEWFDDKGDVVESRTFAGLWAEAGRIAHELRFSRGLEKGDRVVLCYGFGLSFFAAFLGCLRAGVVAVPIYPPSPTTLSKSLHKMQMTVDSCKPRLILLSSDVNALRLASRLNVLSEARKLWPLVPYHCLASADVPSTGARGGLLFSAAKMVLGENDPSTSTAVATNTYDEQTLVAEDIAFLQFTSGSTADPKGVMITFGNLMHNVHLVLTGNTKTMEAFCKGRTEDLPQRFVGFSWLPQYHDLG